MIRERYQQNTQCSFKANVVLYRSETRRKFWSSRARPKVSATFATARWMPRTFGHIGVRVMTTSRVVATRCAETGNKPTQTSVLAANPWSSSLWYLTCDWKEPSVQANAS